MDDVQNLWKHKDIPIEKLLETSPCIDNPKEEELTRNNKIL